MCSSNDLEYDRKSNFMLLATIQTETMGLAAIAIPENCNMNNPIYLKGPVVISSVLHANTNLAREHLNSD
jgi:hypothetical protein